MAWSLEHELYNRFFREKSRDDMLQQAQDWEEKASRLPEGFLRNAFLKNATLCREAAKAMDVMGIERFPERYEAYLKLLYQHIEQAGG